VSKIPEKGYVCIGPYRGWCGHVHRNKKTAKRCLAEEDQWCQRNIYRHTDREVIDIHDPRTGKKKINVYYLKPEIEQITEVSGDVKVAMVKVLKPIYNQFSIGLDDLLTSTGYEEEELAGHIEMLEQLKVIRRIGNKKQPLWQCMKTQDEHKWAEVFEHFLTAVGGIE